MSRRDPKHPVPEFGLASLWRGLVRDLFDGYRPERHYMRGAGPASKRSHGAGSQA